MQLVGVLLLLVQGQYGLNTGLDASLFLVLVQLGTAHVTDWVAKLAHLGSSLER